MIPEWFKHQSIEGTFSFWFRNKFPFIMIFFTTTSETLYGRPVLSFVLHINNFKANVYAATFLLAPSHTYLYNLSMLQEIEYDDKLMAKLDEAFEKNEWIHAEINLHHDKFHLYFKEENNVDDIRFTNPYEKRKLRYLSLSQQCFQPLLKKQRLLDVEDLDTELVEEELQHRMSLLLFV
jgi:hypothetical protein